MRLKEAAFIIGSMGGRPPINVDRVMGKPVWSYRGGYAPASDLPEFGYVTEDDLDYYVTEDDSDYYVWA